MFINPESKTNWDNVKMTAEGHRNALCGVSINTKKGVEFLSIGFGACHGGFKNRILEYQLKNNFHALWSKLGVLHCEKDLAKFYYTWLMNESPWASAFMEKSYDRVKISGFMVDPNLPHDYVASALVATRWCTEHYTPWTVARLPLYEKLLEVMDPLWAFIGANLYRPNNTKEHSFAMQSGHEMLPPGMGLRGLKMFVDGAYTKSLSFTSNNGYSSIGTTWGGNTQESEQLKTLAKSWFVKKGEKADFNVFRKPDVNGGYPVLSFEELVVVINQIKEQVSDQEAA